MDIKRANKVMKKLQSADVLAMFAKIGNEANWYLLVMSDAGFANLYDHVFSAGGHVILLIGENGRCCPLSWKSNKNKKSC